MAVLARVGLRHARLRLRHLRPGGLGLRVGLLELQIRDAALGLELLVAGGHVERERGAGLGGHQPRLGLGDLRVDDLRVEVAQRLAGLHQVALGDAGGGQAAAHLEGERQQARRAELAGDGFVRAGGDGARGDDAQLRDGEGSLGERGHGEQHGEQHGQAVHDGSFWWERERESGRRAVRRTRRVAVRLSAASRWVRSGPEAVPSAMRSWSERTQ